MKIALLGYGVEAESAYKYYKNIYPSAEFVSYDDKPEPKNTLPPDVAFMGDYHDFYDIDADIVVRTPAIAPSRVSSKGTITSATKEFFDKCPAPIIGVTGTKGKGTTCSLIAEILKSAGKTVWLVGNIGAPALDVLEKIQPDDIVVYELSSFQLWELDKSPQVAVVLMIESDHMDVHNNFEDYLEAKMNIALHQTQDDEVVYHPTNTYSQMIAERSPAATKKKYLTSEGAYVVTGTVVIDEQIICSVKEVGLIGQHNLENICAAITATWRFVKDVDAIKQAVAKFKGLEHRLEFVRELNGIRFYNDSFSSVPGATLAAIKSFDAPEIIIMGGFDKQGSFEEFAKVAVRLTNIKKILLIGQTKDSIAESLKKAGMSNFEVMPSTDFKEVVEQAYNQAIPGDVVVLSPGCASFDMFKNFYERGEQYKQIVSDLSV